MTVLYILFGISILLLIIILIKLFTGNNKAQQQAIENLYAQLEEITLQQNARHEALQSNLQRIEADLLAAAQHTEQSLHSDIEQGREALRKEILVNRLELNNQVLRSRQDIKKSIQSIEEKLDNHRQNTGAVQ